MRVKITDNFNNSTGFHAISVKQACELNGGGELLTQVEGDIEIEIENFTHLSHMFPLLFKSEAELLDLITFFRSFNRNLSVKEK